MEPYSHFHDLFFLQKLFGHQMADFHISIEGMYTEDGELDLFNDRPEPIVPPKVQIKGNYEYLMTDQDGHQHRTNLT
jgi:hypothetical protein